MCHIRLIGLVVVLATFQSGHSKYATEETCSNRAECDYEVARRAFINEELSRSFGSKIILNEDELDANEVLMRAKNEEIAASLFKPEKFNPSRHIFSVLERIDNSKLFHMIRKMPKGAVLHAHDTSMASTDFLMELSYREHLWVCLKQNLDFIDIRFSLNEPTITTSEPCTWELLANLRMSKGANVVDSALRSRFTLFPQDKFIDTYDVWSHFGRIFQFSSGMFTYVPVWKDYFYHVFGEYLEDGVIYMEIRSVLLPLLYDLENTYSQSDTVRFTKESVDRFKANNPDFIGAKLIFSPQRNSNNSQMEEHINTVIALKSEFPDFVVGFDLVRHEEDGHPIKHFAKELLKVPSDISFFFHAGEAGWMGTHSDENVIDAVLLGTKRIGHGYSLVKHPSVMKAIKERDIAVEVCPISNQVLQLLGNDFRNHPAVHLFADDYPVVISSDDRSFFGTKPLSHDFYIAFLGMASAHSDVRMLKQLAMNSIRYSAMENHEKQRAMRVWQEKWNTYAKWLAQGGIE